jgi:hypothetical protein
VRYGEDKTPLHYAELVFGNMYLKHSYGTGVSRRNNREYTTAPSRALGEAFRDESPESLNTARRRFGELTEFGTCCRPIKWRCIRLANLTDCNAPS